MEGRLFYNFTFLIPLFLISVVEFTNSRDNTESIQGMHLEVIITFAGASITQRSQICYTMVLKSLALSESFSKSNSKSESEPKIQVIKVDEL